MDIAGLALAFKIRPTISQSCLFFEAYSLFPISNGPQIK